MIYEKQLKNPGSLFLTFYDNKIIKKINDYFIPVEISDVFLNNFVNNARLFCQKRLAITIIAIASSFIMLALSTYFFIYDLLIILFAILSYFYLIIKINNYISKQRIELEKIIPLLRLEIRFLLKITKEEHDILKLFIEILHFILYKSYGNELQNFHFKLLSGQLPETILKNFDSPSKKLNELLHACCDIHNLKFISNENENFQQYKIFLKTLESRLVIFVAEGIFLPIITTLVYIFGIVPIPIHFCFLIMHLLILRYFSKILLNKQFPLLYFTDFFSENNNKNLDNFMDVLANLGKNVKYNALEVGLFKTIAQTNQKILNDLGVVIQKNIRNLDFSHFLEEIALNSKSKIIRLVTSIIFHLKKFAGENLADLIIDITSELKCQRDLEDEKNNIVSAERFKIKIVIFFIPFILSILTVLFQIMMIPENINNAVSASSISFKDSLFNGIILLFLNSCYNYLSCYYLTRIAGIISYKKYSVLSTLVFFIIYLAIYVSLPTS